MDTYETSPCLKQLQRMKLVKQRFSYSGGFKYPDSIVPKHIVISIEKESPLTQNEIMKQLGITKPPKPFEALPHRDNMPQNKVELLNQLIDNVDHKLSKLRCEREKSMRNSQLSVRFAHTF